MSEEKIPGHKRAEKILQENGKPMLAMDIAKQLVDMYPDEAQKKIENSLKVKTKPDLWDQYEREIGSYYNHHTFDSKVIRRKQNKTYMYYWSEDGSFPPPIDPPLFTDPIKPTFISTIDIDQSKNSELIDFKKKYDEVYARCNLNYFFSQHNQKKDNERECGTHIDRILEELLGYDNAENIERQKDITTIAEDNGFILPRNSRLFVDYLLSLNSSNLFIIESKRHKKLSVEKRLSEKDEKQLKIYTKCLKIRWAILTNLKIWKLYKLNQQKTDNEYIIDLVFSLEIKDNLDDKSIEFLQLLSRKSINENSYSILERTWLNKKLLGKENLNSVIVSDNIFIKIRDELKEQKCSSTDDEIKEALHNLLQR